MITHTVLQNRPGPKTYFLKYNEAHISETSEKDGAQGLPRDAMSLANALQQETYVDDKSFRHKPQEGNAKRSQAILVDVPKGLYHVSQYQQQIINNC